MKPSPKPAMRDDVTMTERRGSGLLVLGCVVLSVLAVCFVTWLNYHRRHAHYDQLSNALKADAIKCSSASTNYAQARSWLTQNGFIGMGPGTGESGELDRRQPGEPPEHYNIVDGYKLLAPANAMHGDYWIEMCYLFDGRGTFVRIEMYGDAVPPRRIKK